MKRLACIVVLGLLPLAALCEDKPSSVIMARKLDHSKGILEGLATEDFELIATNAKVMSTFTQLESWFRADVPEYKAQLELFRVANKQVIRQAEAKNLDGASLAYVQLTLSCVQCHKVIRDHAR